MGLTRILPALLLLCALAAKAEPVELYVMDIPPMSSQTAASHGVVGEIVLEAMRRAGITPKLVFVPKNRAILTVQLPGSVDKLILPIARAPEREANFTWISALYRAERGFFTLGTRLRSFAEARKTMRAVAVARGTINLGILREQGFKPQQLYEINNNDDVPRMLLEERMDAWFGPIEEMQVHLRAQALSDRIIAGPGLMSTDNYLACSKRCNPALVARLAAELEKMEKDGSSQAIRNKHGAPGSAVAHH
jgi:polar amino acid transport system substrate-binding protein